MIKHKVIILNKLGLHTRAAAKFVATAGRFSSKIEIAKNNRSVNGKSIMGVMLLAASHGTELELRIEGDDAKEALHALTELIKDRFGEEV